eukprot:s1338_g3.t1
MEEVIQDPFPNDPPIPEDVPKDSLAQCVRGRVAWLVDNPGRQQSFGQEGAHLSTHLEDVIARCAANDADGLRELLSQDLLSWSSKTEPLCLWRIQDDDASDMLGARDFLGRSPLHAAKELLHSPAAGASLLEARLADGRFALHLAAMHGFEDQQGSGAKCRLTYPWLEIAELILEKRLELTKKSAGDGLPKPEEILDIDAADWEVKLSPLQYAVLFGHEGVMQRLLKAGADAKKPAVHKDPDAQANMYGAPVGLSHSTLSLCAKFAGDSRKLEEAARMAKMLMAAGASTSQDVLELLLSLDTAKEQVLDVLDSSGKSALVLATSARNAKAVRHLLKHRAQAQLSDEEYAARKRRADTSSKMPAVGMFGRILLTAENACIDCLTAFIEHRPDLLQTTLTLKGQQPQSLLDICEQNKASQPSLGGMPDDSAKQEKKRLEAAQKACDQMLGQKYYAMRLTKQPEGSYNRMLWSREVWRQKYMQRQSGRHGALFGPSGNSAAEELKSRTEAFIQLLKDYLYVSEQLTGDPLQEYAEVPAGSGVHLHYVHRGVVKLPKGEQGLAHSLFTAAYEEDPGLLAF